MEKTKNQVREFCVPPSRNFQKGQVHYRSVNDLYEPGDKWLQALIQTSVDKVNYKEFLKAIAHTDFPAWKPRLDNYGFLTSKEVYFIDINSCMIFNMYDGRGLDIISPDIKSLESIHETFNEWILDFDRELIDKQMKK